MEVDPQLPLFDENAILHVDALDGVLINPSPVQLQQEYFENLGDTDWIRYKKEDRHCLVQNIAFALFGSPNTEGDLNTDVNIDEGVNLRGYNSRQTERVMSVYEKICEQSKYSYDDDIIMSVILVVCARPKPVKFYQITPSKEWIDLHERNDVDIWCTAVFRIRKCIPTTVNAKPCRIYIDDCARVYHDWNSYLLDNTLIKCVLIVPEHGEYNGVQMEGTFSVKLTVAPSPALGIKARVLSSMDTTSTIASLGAIGVIGVAAFTPVAPVVLVGAAVATVTTGVYGLVRSSMSIHDRRTHEQSINPVTDADARNCWINIAASSVGLAAGAASGLLSKSAAAGTNLSKAGQFLSMSVDVLRHANLVTGGVGVLNSFVHIVVKFRKHKERPTTLEIFQLTSSMLFFFSAAVSNKTAQSIIEEAQTNTINEYRTSLRSNRHRKIFDKVSAETRRVQGVIQGNTEVIKGISKIADKNEFFASVLKINKDVNQHKLKISMTSDGEVNINSQYKYNPTELHSLGKEGRSQLFSTLDPAPSGPKNVPTRLTSTVTPVETYASTEEEERNMLVGVHPGEILRIGSLLYRISTTTSENIASTLQDLSEDVYTNLMTVAFKLLSELVPEEIAKLKLLSPDEDLITQVVNFVFNFLKHQRPFGETSQDDNSIITVLKEFFQDGRVNQETILTLKNQFLSWINEELDHHQQQRPDKKSSICENCKGVRFA